ncbi:hypothetical protein CPB84DRAFT_1950478 [Gymnopilus junonius]|uniref:Uncharacterized protein n=1 Tax=Gymnopilus junonius TaxID=109634 RepID=A0A9P5NHW3_GYMJU|nr:hypothetical protein CPB84DRAFT_1950478 [Gymnopilus junonius]
MSPFWPRSAINPIYASCAKIFVLTETKISSNLCIAAAGIRLAVADPVDRFRTNQVGNVPYIVDDVPTLRTYTTAECVGVCLPKLPTQKDLESSGKPCGIEPGCHYTKLYNFSIRGESEITPSNCFLVKIVNVKVGIVLQPKRNFESVGADAKGVQVLNGDQKDAERYPTRLV